MLIEYLFQHFITRDHLLEQAGVSRQELEQLQSDSMMPKPSYQLDMSINCVSFFGPHEENSAIEFYSKGNVEWLSLILRDCDSQRVRSVFDNRYQKQLTILRDKGFHPSMPNALDTMAEHLDNEWGYFLDGTYGLCTKSGLPEDIAAKELAIIIIKEHLDVKELTDEQKLYLKSAVDLLDSVTSLFAPHERAASSRKRLIEDVRRAYALCL